MGVSVVVRLVVWLEVTEDVGVDVTDEVCVVVRLEVAVSVGVVDALVV